MNLNWNSSQSLSAGAIGIYVRDQGDSDVLAAVNTDTGITDGQWNVAINVLLAQDLVTKTGGRRAARYRNARIGDSS